MLLPSLRGVGSMTAQTATQNPSFRIGPCASGDLLIVMAGKRAGSNFTFPSGFTIPTSGQTAQSGVTSGMASAFAWKWGTLTDSGATIVVSTSGAGNLFHAVSLALRDVHSTSNPIENLTFEVQSRNYTLTGSLTALGQALGVCLVVGFDNVGITQTGFVANSWTVANSHTTSTGSDGHLDSYLRPFVLTNSGAQFNPSSGAGTAPRHMYTFQVRGAGELLTQTISDQSIAPTDSFTRSAQLFLNIASDALAILSASPQVIKTFALLANDGFSLTDAFIKDVVGQGSGQVYTETRSDNATLSDDVARYLLARRLAADSLAALDTELHRRVLGRYGTDAAALVDSAWGARLVARLANDALRTDDSFVKALFTGGVVFTHTATDTAAITGALVRAWRATRMLGEAITPADERQLHTNLMRTVGAALRMDDAALRLTLRNRLLQDVANAGDAFTRRLAARRQTDDVLTLSDAVTWHARRVRQPTDSVSLIDAFLAQGSSSKVLTDGALVEDGTLAAARRNRLASDMASILDELRFSRQHGRVLADLLTVDDKRHFTAFLRRGDALTAIDAHQSTRLLARALQDALTLGDGFAAAAAGLRVRVLGDTITVEDGHQRVTILRHVSGDSIALADAHIALTAGLKAKTLTDTLTASDQRVSGTIRNRRLQDFVVALYDQAVRGTERWRILSDVLSPRDFVVKLLARVALLSDDLTLDDQGLRAALRVRALYDVLEATDTFTKAVADALANLLDVRIMIGIDPHAPILGQHAIVRLGADVAPALGRHAITWTGADAPPVLGGYN